MRKKTTPLPNEIRIERGEVAEKETALSADAGFPEPRIRLRRAAARRFPPGESAIDPRIVISPRWILPLPAPLDA